MTQPLGYPDSPTACIPTGCAGIFDSEWTTEAAQGDTWQVHVCKGTHLHFYGDGPGNTPTVSISSANTCEHPDEVPEVWLDMPKDAAVKMARAILYHYATTPEVPHG